jgi:hypothetical protein
MNKKLYVPALAIMLLGATAFGVSAVSAESFNAENNRTSLIQKLATKFNLKQEDVKSVFDEQRQTRETERQARFEEKLSLDVTSGKITETQKQAIIAKMKTLAAERQAHMDAMKNMTPEQRKAEMEKHRTSIEQWAKDNNIDSKYLYFGYGKGMGHKMGPRY